MALQLSRGYPPERYIRRLLPFALLAQVPYAVAFGFPVFWPLNILFSLLSVALFRVRWWEVAGLLSLLSEVPPAPLLVEALVRNRAVLGGVLRGGWLWISGWPWPYALIGGLAVPVAWFLVKRARPGRRSPWWVFYAFYPAHLALIALVKTAWD